MEESKINGVKPADIIITKFMNFTMTQVRGVVQLAIAIDCWYLWDGYK